MKEYYIYSIKWSQNGDDIIWWGTNNSGYTKHLEHAGRYTEEKVKSDLRYYNNHESTMAIPCDEVELVALRVVPREFEGVEALKKVAMPVIQE